MRPIFSDRAGLRHDVSLARAMLDRLAVAVENSYDTSFAAQVRRANTWITRVFDSLDCDDFGALAPLKVPRALVPGRRYAGQLSMLEHELMALTIGGALDLVADLRPRVARALGALHGRRLRKAHELLGLTRLRLDARCASEHQTLGVGSPYGDARRAAS